MAMKRFVFLLITLGVTAAVQADDELDAKLAALKKRAPRSAYSTRAALHNQEMVVPQGPTDEEQALDAKLRAMEKKLDSDSGSMLRRTIAPRPITPQVQQNEEGRNWLTPALLSSEDQENSPFGNDAPDWIQQELTRQADVRRGNEEQADEQSLVDQRLKETLRPAESEQYNPLPSYTSGLQNFIPERQPGIQDEAPSPMSNFQRAPGASREPLYGTELERAAPRAQSTFSISTENSVPKSRFAFPARRETQEEPSSKKPSFKSSWDVINNDPLPARKDSRNSLFNSDPFEDDILKKPKTSIWDN